MYKEELFGDVFQQLAGRGVAHGFKGMKINLAFFLSPR